MSCIEKITLQNFRNHTSSTLTFEKSINVILGENGSGKTAILEAVYSLSTGKSFRTRNYLETLNEKQENMLLSGVFSENGNQKTIKLMQTKNGKRKIFINDIELVKRKDLIGEFPIVLLSPEEQSLTKGPETERRKYFDMLFSVLSHNYLNSLLQYQRVLKQRNYAIQNALRNKGSKNEIEAWNKPLVLHGVKLWKTKKEFFAKFSSNLSDVLKKYDENNLFLRVVYIQECDEDLFENRLEKSLNSDLKKGRTLTGPQADKYNFYFNDRMLRNYGSQGEHKLALVLLKMAEIKTITDETQKTPILLLDDLFAKLDLRRTDDVMLLLNGKQQTLITTTDLIDLQKHNNKHSFLSNRTILLEKKCKA